VEHKNSSRVIITTEKNNDDETKAINKEKLPQLGYTTGRNSYWLVNVARLLDVILTPGQRIEIRERP